MMVVIIFHMMESREDVVAVKDIVGIIMIMVGIVVVHLVAAVME